MLVAPSSAADNGIESSSLRPYQISSEKRILVDSFLVHATLAVPQNDRAVVQVSFKC